MAKLKLVSEQDKQKAEAEAKRLTGAEIASRVSQLRKELEAAKQRYDGALFDNYYNGMPPSLDVVDENREPYGAVQYLSPSIERDLSRAQESQNYDALGLFVDSTQLAFQFGMLAGAIYADCPTATVDRFERGLVTALTASDWIAKKEDRL